MLHYSLSGLKTKTGLSCDYLRFVQISPERYSTIHQHSLTYTVVDGEEKIIDVSMTDLCKTNRIALNL